MGLKGGKAAFDFLIAGDKSQGCAKSLGRRVGGSLGSEADDIVEGAYLMLDGQEVPRQYIGTQVLHRTTTTAAGTRRAERQTITDGRLNIDSSLTFLQMPAMTPLQDTSGRPRLERPSSGSS